MRSSINFSGGRKGSPARSWLRTPAQEYKIRVSQWAYPCGYFGSYAQLISLSCPLFSSTFHPLPRAMLSLPSIFPVFIVRIFYARESLLKGDPLFRAYNWQLVSTYLQSFRINFVGFVGSGLIYRSLNFYAPLKYCPILLARLSGPQRKLAKFEKASSGLILQPLVGELQFGRKGSCIQVQSTCLSADFASVPDKRPQYEIEIRVQPTARVHRLAVCIFPVSSDLGLEAVIARRQLTGCHTGFVSLDTFSKPGFNA